MPQGYYCGKCAKFVLTEGGRFVHPHLGVKTSLVCYKCGQMVCLREQRDEIPA